MAKELFCEYLKEKNIQEPHDKKELAQVSKSLFLEARKKMAKKQWIIKKLLDEVFVISGIIKVSVSVVSLSLRLQMITLTSTLIISDIKKTSRHPIIVYKQLPLTVKCLHSIQWN